MNHQHVLVVLQTHSKGDSQHYENMVIESRFCNAPKSEVMRRCTRSLVESMNYAKELLPMAEFELVVYDDHSDQSAVDELKKNLNIATFKTQFIELDTFGIMPSILKCYEHGRDHGRGIVYFAQDDYLYDPKAIYDMINTALISSNNLGNFVSIYPFDDPYRYIPINTNTLSHMIRCQGRHWRTQVGTASCFMTFHKVIVDNWDLFEAMGKAALSQTMEDDSINKLFQQRGYYLLVPIPSLALHMQYSTEKDDQINWREWWDRYDRPAMLQPTEDKTLLNVGFGGVKIENHKYMVDDLRRYREITLDADSSTNPDIIADITNISHLPDKFVDVVFSSHMIEHLHFFKVPLVINELLRITKPGGFVRIITPNLKTVIEKLITGKLLDTLYESEGGAMSAMDVIFGSRYHSHRHNNDFMIHKCGFTPEVFRELGEKYKWNMLITEYEAELEVNIQRIS